MATRQSGEITMRFRVNWPIRPSKKQPDKLTSSVPYGKVLAVRICTRPCRPYRASVPAAPKIAINARRNFAPIRPGKSVVETITQLDKNFARIQVVGAAKGKAVVEEDAAVGDVDALQVDGKPFAETLADRKVESGVRLQVAWRRTAVG